MFMSTKYESLMIIIFQLFHAINYKKVKNIIILVAITAQFIEVIFNNLHKILIATILKYNYIYPKSFFSIVYFEMFQQYCKYIYNNIYSITSCFWYRKISII
uniref:Uncharacterized protein n=1 Tax=Nitophyllum punctatum TaxID=158729 RepID=A0A4D6WYC5_9FLOR|nr:hypothetical protein [Nitophyllum punctatum]